MGHGGLPRLLELRWAWAVRRRLAGVLLTGLALATPAFADPPAPAATPSTHAALDWSAPNRWVHVDNIAKGRLEVFETARHGWLQALRQGDSLLADGRPLFWGHRAPEPGTYFTFYPFRRFGELDARRDAVRATQAVVGKEALARYDSADSVLVAPHYSQIWRRSADDDYVPAGSESCTELTAAGGWLETRVPSFEAGAVVDSLWKELRTALAAEHYPLVCRVFVDVYGSSSVFCLWMAPDSATLQAAPALKDVVRRHLGDAQAKQFWRRLDAVFPVTSTTTVERRADMSNLGK
jgi:hypothetical protein